MKKGFTLIELLAVILILGIIALIAIPTVTSVIEDSKKSALKVTADTLADAAEKQCQIEQIHGDSITSLYSINNKNISSPLDIKNLPDSGSISVDDECNASVAIHNDNYCAIKNGESTIINSNVSNCKLDYIVTPDTEESCFIFDSNTRTITGYNFSNASCPNSIVIPATINDIPVENIGDFAFVELGGKTLLYYMYNEDETSNLRDLKKENAEIYGLDINMIDLVTTSASTQKACYTYIDRKDSNYVLKDINYIGTSTDGYLGCALDGFTPSTTRSRIALVDFTKADNLKTIGDGAFMNNSITTVYFDNNNTFNYIGNSVFLNNIMTGTVNLAGLNYSKIPNAMFGENKIDEVVYNDGITTIGKYAFYDNNIVNYNLPNNLVTIDVGAFLFNNSDLGKVTTLLTIPDSVVNIKTSALSANNITSLVLGSGVKRIEPSAFNNSQLASITLNEGLEDIGYFSFAYNHITKIVIPDSVRNIEAGCFNHNAVTSQANGAFITKRENGIKDTSTIMSVATIPNAAITLSGIKTIAEDSLTNINFASLSLPDIVTIEDYAVQANLVKYAKITVGASIASIGPNSFNCNDSAYCGYTISINRLTNSVLNSPWGNTYATITWTGTS